MKKCFKLLSAALIALASFVPAQAVELTVFDGTATNECVPVRSYYYDTQDYPVQTIMPEAQLEDMVGGTISSMKFYIATEGGNLMNGGKLAVSIGTTEMNSFYQSLITEGLTKVAEITMTPGETEVVVNFNTPWAYEGGNIVIETKVVETGNCPHVFFYGQVSDVANAGYGKSFVTTEKFYPKTTFTYEPAVVPENLAAISAEAIDFGTLFQGSEDTKTITLKNKGQNPFTPVFGSLNAPFSLNITPVELAYGESLQIPVKFVADAIGEYNQTLTIDCGEAGLFNVAITAETVEAPAEIVVAEGTATSNVVPIETGDYDYTGGNNQSQMIYNADLLSALVGKKINGLKFHASAPLQALNGGKIQLSLKVVEQSAFESATAITDLTVVATGSAVLGESELVFNFDEPFEYNGGNLVVEALVIEAGGYSFKDKFLGVNTTEYVSYAHFNSNGWESHVYKFLPMATFSYVKEDTPEPEVLRGDVNKDKTVNIADVTALIDMLLNDAEMIPEADCNKDTLLNISDVTALIDFLLNGQW